MQGRVRRVTTHNRTLSSYLCTVYVVFLLVTVGAASSWTHVKVTQLKFLVSLTVRIGGGGRSHSCSYSRFEMITENVGNLSLRGAPRQRKPLD